MLIKWGKYRYCRAVAPADMRKGLLGLSELSRYSLGLNVSDSPSMVSFVSRSRRIMKVVATDSKGPFMITRVLNRGCFPQAVTDSSEQKIEELSQEEFKCLWHGQLYLEKSAPTTATDSSGACEPIINWSQYRNLLCIAPVDLRQGLPSLGDLSRRQLGWDLQDGKHMAVFTSNNGRLMKMVACDHSGSFMVTRTLNKGEFQRLSGLTSAKAIQELSLIDLFRYWQGVKIQTKRSCTKGLPWREGDS